MSYRDKWLTAPGRYRVTLSHSEWFRDDGPDSPGGLRTFTGGVEFEVSATAFAGAVSVKGRVSGPPDLVAGVRTVMLDGEGRAAAESADVQADGSFEFPLIVTGTYTIRGVPDRLAPGRTIVVPDRDLVDVVLETPHRDVRGRVRLGPAGTIPAFALLIRPDIEGARDVRIAVRPAADGTLTVALPIGAWTAGIAEGLPAGIGIVSMTYGDTDLLRDRFVVAPEDGHELNIVLGRVTTANARSMFAL